MNFDKKIGLQDYLEAKKLHESERPQYRNLCLACMNPEFSCYCSTIQKFDPGVQFVILIHPIEFQRRIATGRMSHLILEKSSLIRGQDYSKNLRVNALLEDANNHCVILYPSPSSINLSEVNIDSQRKIFPKDKKLTVFVIDGTWATARQMMRQSQNLQNLQKVCFTPKAKSNFRVRKQPEAHCLSTIEAIHQFIDIASDHLAFDASARPHDILLKVFDTMVERQIRFAEEYDRPRISKSTEMLNR